MALKHVHAFSPIVSHQIFVGFKFQQNMKHYNILINYFKNFISNFFAKIEFTALAP